MDNMYNDMLYLPHFEPHHNRMTISGRSAQFAPFAALTGYSDQIYDASRYVEDEMFITDDYKETLDRKLELIKNHLDEKPEVIVKYFAPDKTKKGGKYIEHIGNLKKIDYINKQLCFMDNSKINLVDLKDLKLNSG